jgi:CRP/FNR family transcriptional regulator, cyclic AMP receptor protein
MMSNRRVVKLLTEDRELGVDLDPRRLAAATEHARVAVMALARGEWSQEGWPMIVRHGAGLLLLDGLLLRYVEVEGRSGAELLGHGDLLRPWQEDADMSVRDRSGWRVLSRARIAVLDIAFMERIAAYPEIQGRLVERSTSRARHLAFALAIVNQPLIERRLRMMLWHIAERWGTVRANGVLIPKVTHEVLGELIAARRPTVSSALRRLERQDEIVRTGEGWLLRERRATPRVPRPGT